MYWGVKSFCHLGRSQPWASSCRWRPPLHHSTQRASRSPSQGRIPDRWDSPRCFRGSQGRWRVPVRETLTFEALELLSPLLLDLPSPPLPPLHSHAVLPVGCFYQGCFPPSFCPQELKTVTDTFFQSQRAVTTETVKEVKVFHLQCLYFMPLKLIIFAPNTFTTRKYILFGMVKLYFTGIHCICLSIC